MKKFASMFLAVFLIAVTAICLEVTAQVTPDLKGPPGIITVSISDYVQPSFPAPTVHVGAFSISVNTIAPQRSGCIYPASDLFTTEAILISAICPGNMTSDLRPSCVFRLCDYTDVAIWNRYQDNTLMQLARSGAY